jgi:electron transfer flavoprotein beta subunit
MRIVVPVKYVPDASGDRGFNADNTTLRDGGRLSELDEYAVEQALRVVESGTQAEIVFLTMGPEAAVEALRKSLAMGGDSAVHVVDDALAGTDAVGTSAVLAAAIAKLEADLVICGMSSTDGTMSVVPAMLAERLGWPQVTLASELTVTGETVTIRRDLDAVIERVESSVPAVVSVTDFTGEARYPSFKGIMAAKKKPMQTWSLADLGLDAAGVGAAGSWTTVQEITKRPARQAGTIVKDEGDGGIKAAEFLASQKFV